MDTKIDLLKNEILGLQVLLRKAENARDHLRRELNVRDVKIYQLCVSLVKASTTQKLICVQELLNHARKVQDMEDVGDGLDKVWEDTHYLNLPRLIDWLEGDITRPEAILVQRTDTAASTKEKQ